METIRNIRETFAVSSLATLIAGLFLLLFPGLSTQIICYVIAGAFTVGGIGQIANEYRVMKSFTPQMTVGIVMICAGIFTALRSDVIVSIIPVVFCIFLLVSGIGSIQNYITMRRLNYDKKRSSLVFAVVKIILALIVLENPFSTALMLFRFLGAILIADSITGLISAAGVHKAERDAEKAREDMNDELRDMNLSKRERREEENENIETVEAEVVGVDQPVIDAEENE